VGSRRHINQRTGQTTQLTDVVSELSRSRLVVTAARWSPSNCSFRCGRTTRHNVVILSDRPAPGAARQAGRTGTVVVRTVDVALKWSPDGLSREPRSEVAETAADTAMERPSVAESMRSLGAVIYDGRRGSVGRSVDLICLFNRLK